MMTDATNDNPLWIRNAHSRYWLIIGIVFVALSAAVATGTFPPQLSPDAPKVDYAFLTSPFAAIGLATLFYAFYWQPRSYLFSDDIQIQYLFRSKTIPWTDVSSIEVERPEGEPQNGVDMGGSSIRHQAAAMVAGAIITHGMGVPKIEVRLRIIRRQGPPIRLYMSPDDVPRLAKIWEANRLTTS